MRCQDEADLDVEVSGPWRLRLTILAVLSLAAWLVFSYPAAEALVVIERIVARLATL